MKKQFKYQTLVFAVSKGVLMLFVLAICLKPAVKLYTVVLDDELELIENVSEKDLEEEKVDDNEEFEKLVNESQFSSRSKINSSKLNYFKFQQLQLEFFPAVVSPPPELS